MGGGANWGGRCFLAIFFEGTNFPMPPSPVVPPLDFKAPTRALTLTGVKNKENNK